MGSTANIKILVVVSMENIQDSGLEDGAYSELRGPHLSHGSFLLISEGRWEISWMSPSVQQLSVIGKNREIFWSSVSQDISFDTFIILLFHH